MNGSPFDGHPIHTERHLSIVCIGAGASGLCFAYKIKRSFKNVSLTILEKNKDLGGTWHENTYPGCTCDVPSHVYSFSFEPKTDWKNLYSSAAEIKTYFQDFANKYELKDLIKFGHLVQSARWNGDVAQWVLNVCADQMQVQVFCDILVLGTGYLNDFSWPDVSGLNQFQGRLVHTAQWDESIDLNGKVVGVLGNGSSAIQVIPAIVKQTAKVINFVRSPTYVWDRGNENFTLEAIYLRTVDPEGYLTLRKKHERMLNSLFPAYLKASPLQSSSNLQFRTLMEKRLTSPELRASLIPQWGIGCRRLTPGAGYLDAITNDKIQVVLSGVSKFTPHGCETVDGRDFDLDIAICATGFDTSFRPRFPLIGRDGLDLREHWKTAAKSYLGLAVPHFPNMFMFTGPQSPLAGACVLPIIEHQADYMLQLIDRYQTENIRAFDPKQEVMEDFIAISNDFIKRTVWDENCSSWYKDRTFGTGLSKLWPGSPLHYFEAIRDLRADDWNIQYNGNRFAWLGNGSSQAEYDPTCDLAYYITNSDDSEPASKSARREKITGSGTQPARQLHTILRVD